jgi:3-dehydroquinate dehydratase
MKIEVKSIKVMPSLSQDSTAYSATIFVDGKKAFIASNTGTGGCDFIQQVGDVKESDLAAFIAANEPAYYDVGFMDAPTACDVEVFISRVIAREETRKHIMRQMKKSIFAFNRDGKVISFKAAPTPEMLAKFKQSRPDYRAINDNPALIEEAINSMVQEA